MRSPRARHHSSPAVRFLQATLLRPPTPDACAAWSERLAAGGIVREIAREVDLRRALPLVDRWLGEAGLLPRLPPDEVALLVAARLAGQSSAARLAATLTPLGAAARSEGVAPLLLKGTALHGTLYASPALRPVADADVYVAPEALPAMRRALAAAGFGPDAMTAARLADFDASGGRAFRLSDLVFTRRADTGEAGNSGLARVPVEIKLDPVQIGLPLRRGRSFADGATPSPCYPGFLVPAPEAMAVQQALHLARHDGSDLLWWAELARGIARATEASRFDAERAIRPIVGEGLEGTVREAFCEAEALFPGSIPEAARRARRGAGPTLGRFRSRQRAAPRPDERAATLSLSALHATASARPFDAAAMVWRRFWPSDAYLRARLGLRSNAHVGLSARARRLVDTLRGRVP